MLKRVARATVVCAVSLAMISVLGGTAAEAATTPVQHERISIQSDGRLLIQLTDPEGARGEVVLGLTNGAFTDIEVEAQTDGRVHRDKLKVESFAITGSDNFRAALRSHSTPGMSCISTAPESCNKPSLCS